MGLLRDPQKILQLQSCYRITKTNLLLFCLWEPFLMLSTGFKEFCHCFSPANNLISRHLYQYHQANNATWSQKVSLTGVEQTSYCPYIDIWAQCTGVHGWSIHSMKMQPDISEPHAALWMQTMSEVLIYQSTVKLPESQKMEHMSITFCHQSNGTVCTSSNSNQFLSWLSLSSVLIIRATHFFLLFYY